MNSNKSKNKLSFFLLNGILLLLGLFIGFFIADKLEMINHDQFIKKSSSLPSQEQIYANQMFNIMKDIDFFIYKTVEEWDTILDSTIPDGAITYNQFIEEYAQAYLNDEDLQEYKETKAYSNLIETAQLIIDQGIIASSDLEKVIPPDSIKDSHDDLSTCVDNYIERKKLIKIFLEENLYIQPPHTCISYFESRDSIYDFIKNNIGNSQAF